MTKARTCNSLQMIEEVSYESPHAFALGLEGVDSQHWLPFMPPEQLGMPPGSKLTLPFPPNPSTS